MYYVFRGVFLISFLQRAVYSINFTETETCFGSLGCFSTGGAFYHPQYRPYSYLPQSPEKIAPSFLLFTRRNLDVFAILDVNSTKIDLENDINFNPKATTRFFIHGFAHHPLTKWASEMKDAFLEVGDDNVILVEWKKGSKFPYAQAAANARVVGAQIAQFVKNIQIPLKLVHIVGHSLGAHVAGYAGERLEGLARITGLDVANPYFSNMPPEVRLDPSDALFVDVIHTSGHWKNFAYGTMQKMGHMDFFPNGGENQPPCKTGVIDMYYHNKTDEFDTGPCEHMRCLDLFTDSIRNSSCRFLGFPCSSWEEFQAGKCLDCSLEGGSCAPMGFYSESYRPRNNATDAYYLVTNTKRNYCAYQYKVTFQFGSGFNDTNGTISIETGQQEFNLYKTIIEMEPESEAIVVSGIGSRISTIESLGVFWGFINTEPLNKKENDTIQIVLRSVTLHPMDFGVNPEVRKFCNTKLTGMKPTEKHQFKKC